MNAAADLKKLHDLLPTDQAVMDELAGLLMELNDYKSLVQLYEDQILRGKDMNARAELARKVARIWEERLTDNREAADAWRRVLRMKAGDAEATQGLERAKSAALKKPEGDPKLSYAPPKLVSEAPVPAPMRPSKAGMPAATPVRAASQPPQASAQPPAPVQPSAPPPVRESAAPKRPSSPKIATGSTTMQTMPPSTPPSAPPRSVPPPLPSHALTGAPPSPELESEIDASLDRLELGDAPTGNTLPPGLSTNGPALDETGETAALDDLSPMTESIASEITTSSVIDPSTLPERSNIRPPMATDPSITRTDAGISAPRTDRGDGDGIDLESTHAGPQDEEEIVIADDLAEYVDEGSAKQLPDDGDENTDAGTTFPRGNG